MKKLDKRLRYMLNALWFLEGMLLVTLLYSFRQGGSWLLPAVGLVTTSLSLWQWEGVSQLIKTKLIPAEDERFGK